MPRVVLQTVRGFVVADEALVSDELPRRSWKLKDWSREGTYEASALKPVAPAAPSIPGQVHTHRDPPPTRS